LPVPFIDAVAANGLFKNFFPGNRLFRDLPEFGRKKASFISHAEVNKNGGNLNCWTSRGLETP
jgi:hypothetical protein